MNKNIIIAVLILIILGETGYIVTRKFILNQNQMPSVQSVSKSPAPMPPAGPNAKGRGPIIISKGMNLKTTPLFQFAYQIAPGDLSTQAKQALVGWNIDSKTQSDGSIVVTLTPKDSEDQSQVYTVKSGQTLYFIEQTLSDDKADQDKDLNYRDDYGLIVDQNGIVQ